MLSEKIKIVKNIFGFYRKQNNEYLFRCPYCKHHKNKLSVNFDANVYKCWVCDARGKNIRRLVRRFGDMSSLSQWDSLTGYDFATSKQTLESLLFDDEEKQGRIYLDMPAGFKTLTKKNKSISDYPAYNYLLNRGLTDYDILRYKIGYCTEGKYKNRIIIPSFDDEGYLNFFVARSYIGDKMKYKNPNVSRDIIFNELNVDWDSDVILTEGVFDAIVARNAVPILGSTLRETSKLFQKIINFDSSVFIALDPDAEEKAMRLVANLLKYDIEVWKMDLPYGKDLGSLTPQQCQILKDEAVSMNYESYYLERQIMSI
tara:strand:- start:995 stop:1939 length:945 start_codon:yes stop_codon:yes gene_type:complete